MPSTRPDPTPSATPAADTACACDTTPAPPQPAMPPHPAIDQARPLLRHFSERDRLETLPDLPDDLEAEVLLSSRDITNAHERYSLRGRSPSHKLAALRCLRWGWINGRNWDRLQGLTDDGRAALRRWLEAREAAGDRAAAKKRRSWFPIEAERQATRLRGEAQARRDDALHDLRVRGIDLAHEHHTMRARLEEIALEIGRGANNVDDLLQEIRDTVRRMDENAAEREQLNAEAERIERDGVPL